MQELGYHAQRQGGQVTLPQTQPQEAKRPCQIYRPTSASASLRSHPICISNCPIANATGGLGDIASPLREVEDLGLFTRMPKVPIRGCEPLCDMGAICCQPPLMVIFVFFWSLMDMCDISATLKGEYRHWWLLEHSRV